MAERPTIDVPTPPGGWGPPWPNVAEIAAALPYEKWTLVGGLMTQLHAIHRGIDAVRPTNDVDIVLHIETTRGVAADAASALESLGYELSPSINERSNTAHRFRRGLSTVDLTAGELDVVDVLVADHAAPRVHEQLRGRDMVAIEGGTQALRRTINACLEFAPGIKSTISVPSVFGGLVLKAAAYRSDTRDRDRHLQDAVVLLAALDDPFADRDQFAGSDRSRLESLAHSLIEDSRHWLVLPASERSNAQAALRILTS